MSIFDKYTYIIAGCRQEAEEYAKLYGVPRNRFFFIDRVDQVHGIAHDSTVWACRQCHDLKSWPEIEKALVSRGVKIVMRM